MKILSAVVLHEDGQKAKMLNFVMFKLKVDGQIFEFCWKNMLIRTFLKVI